jgi:hypothetical protein
MKHFCNCFDEKCPHHPKNHDKGCDPCIADNLQKKKMPACFFMAVSEDVSDVRDYTIKGFVKFCLEQENKKK